MGSSGLPPNPCYAPAERSGQITTGVVPVHGSSRESEPNKPERIERGHGCRRPPSRRACFCDLCQLVRRVSRADVEALSPALADVSYGSAGQSVVVF